MLIYVTILIILMLFQNRPAGDLGPASNVFVTPGLSHNFKPQHVVSLCIVLVT